VRILRARVVVARRSYWRSSTQSAKKGLDSAKAKSCADIPVSASRGSGFIGSKAGADVVLVMIVGGSIIGRLVCK
jgi:hypothetical protein